MQNDGSINSIQAGILRALQLRDKCRFAQLNIDKVPSDQFSYHLRQLVKYGLVEKHPDNAYSLSRRGRTRTLLLYDNQDGFIQQGFLAVRLILSRDSQGRTEYLLHERGISPYRGTYGTPGNKIFIGENVLDAAKRILKETTGLDCVLELKGLHHSTDYVEGELMQDKYFFVCAGHNPTGELIVRPNNKRSIWLSLDEIKDSGKAIQGTLDLLDTAKSPTFQFVETTFYPESY